MCVGRIGVSSGFCDGKYVKAGRCEIEADCGLQLVMAKIR